MGIYQVESTTRSFRRSVYSLRRADAGSLPYGQAAHVHASRIQSRGNRSNDRMNKILANHVRDPDEVADVKGDVKPKTEGLSQPEIDYSDDDDDM